MPEPRKSLMEKRMQLLLDKERFERVESEAKRSGRSMSAVIRDAIDVQFESDRQAKREAAAHFLLITAENRTNEPAEDWADIKRAMDQELIDKFDHHSASVPT